MVKRLPAEWYSQSAIQLTFPHAQTDWVDNLEATMATFVQIAEVISKREKLVVVCQNKLEVEHFLSNCPKENLQFFEVPSNDTWARDHAPITILEDEKPVLLDFSFNGWGLKYPANLDNQISKNLHQQGAYGKMEFRTLNFVLEGGAIESDGEGTILTTAQCLLSPYRNPEFGQQQIEEKLKSYFGAKRILWLNHGYLAGDDTDSHIDTLARFCNAQTIAYIQSTDPEDEHFQALKLMEEELQNFRTLDGKPYQLIPLPMPTITYEKGNRKPATYANFLIINGAVLVPTYQAPEDGKALKILRNCFPQREVIGIDCTALIQQNGSLHCVTMQYMK